MLARAARILQAFTPDEPELSVSEIGRRARLHVATASRLIAALVEQGLLARAANGKVRIGVRLWELAQRASPTLELREAAMPFLEDLHAVIGHHVQLGVLDAGEVLFVERLSARDAVINYTRIAGRLPLHVSSSGHVLLAHGPDELRARAVQAAMVRHTSDTVVTPERLREHLDEVRRNGYALLAGHFHEDATGIAVPVRDALGAVVAALSVIVPNDGRAHRHVPVLLAAAHGVRRALRTGNRALPGS